VGKGVLIRDKAFKEWYKSQKEHLKRKGGTGWGRWGQEPMLFKGTL